MNSLTAPEHDQNMRLGKFCTDRCVSTVCTIVRTVVRQLCAHSTAQDAERPADDHEQEISDPAKLQRERPVPCCRAHRSSIHIFFHALVVTASTFSQASLLFGLPLSISLAQAQDQTNKTDHTC